MMIMSEKSEKDNILKDPKKPKTDDPLRIQKTCPDCKQSKTFEGDTAKQDASIWLAKHLETHPTDDPEPDVKYSKEEKKKVFSLTCDECGHQVVSDDSKRTEELLATHQISHEREIKLSKKQKSITSGDNILFAVGFALLVVSVAIIVGGILLKRQSSLTDKTKDDSK